MNQLSMGSSGPTVAAMQLALNRAGYGPLTLDGEFGEATMRAVMEFQRDYGLEVDGIIGEQTMATLMPFIRGYVTYMVSPGDTLYEIAQNYRTTVHAILRANPTVNPQNLQAGQLLTIPLWFPVVTHDIPYTSWLLAQILDGLAKRYPFLRRSTIGQSVMDKPLHAISIGSGPTRLGYNASHHANEWITTPVLLTFLENYASAFAHGGTIGGQSAQTLYATTNLTLVPMVNPDGVDLVTGFLPTSSAAYQRARAMGASYPNIPFPSGWKANISGVDLNLNYPAGWEQAREIKYAQGFTRPGPRDFVGPGPLSEPESRAMHSWTMNSNFVLTLSYHTQGEVIYWKYLDYEPAHSRAIGEIFAQVSGYALEQTPLVSGHAGYKDWFIQTFNRPGYTIEVGRGENPLPLSQFNDIYRDNLGILVQALVQAVSVLS